AESARVEVGEEPPDLPVRPLQHADAAVYEWPIGPPELPASLPLQRGGGLALDDGAKVRAHAGEGVAVAVPEAAHRWLAGDHLAQLWIPDLGAVGEEGDDRLQVTLLLQPPKGVDEPTVVHGHPLPASA